MVGVGSRFSRLVGTIAALIVVALAAVGCGGGSSTTGGDSTSDAPPKAGGTLNIGQVAEVTTLDPTEIIDTASINVISQIMEPLYKADAEGELQPLLVTNGHSSTDQKTWTFKLRPGVKFSDGKPLTADDVVFSLDAARKSLYYSGLFEAITSVEAKAADTVVIKTKQPMPAMLADLSLYAASIVPDNYGGVSQKEFAQHPIGTGPFKLANWAHGQSLTIVKNPNYWRQGRPYLDKVVFHGDPDDNSRIAQLRSGDLDAIISPPFSQIESLDQAPEITVGEYAEGNTDTVVLNAKAPEFQDPRVREAVDLALDREAIIKVALSGHGTPAGAWLPPVLPYHDSDIEAPAQDLPKAKQLLAEAVKDGADSSFTLLSEAGSTYAGLASQIIQQNLQAAGFDVKLQPLDQSTLYSQIGSGEFSASLTYLYPLVLDPSELVSYYIASNGFGTQAPMGKFSKLAAEANVEVDPEKRRQLYYEIQQLVFDQKYQLALDYQPYTWGLNEGLSGFEVNPLNIAWLSDAGFSG